LSAGDHSGPIQPSPFESFNGNLSKCIHGTKNQSKELTNTIQLFVGTQVLKACVTIRHVTAVNAVSFFSSFNVNSFSDIEEVLSRAELGKPVKGFYRATIKGEIYSCNLYNRQCKRNDCTVCFQDSDGSTQYGEIVTFIEMCEGSKMMLLNCFEVEPARSVFHETSGTVIHHVIPIKDCSALKALPVECLQFKVIRVNDFLCLRPNAVEVNL